MSFIVNMGSDAIMKRFLVLAAVVSGAFAGGASMGAGNVEAGAGKAVACQACHGGATGVSPNPEWPNLAGLGADYIAQQLQQFKDGKRANPVMMPIATGLSGDDMADVAAYFGSLPNPSLEADPSYWKAGEKLYRGGDPVRAIPACIACHGATGRGADAAKFPALHGQQSVYVSKQLHDYASGARPAGAGNIMQTIAKRLSENDMRSVAAYVQGIR
jgi:cytochrome c553